jgi:hypothetical protein
MRFWDHPRVFSFFNYRRMQLRFSVRYLCPFLFLVEFSSYVDGRSSGRCPLDKVVVVGTFQLVAFWFGSFLLLLLLFWCVCVCVSSACPLPGKKKGHKVVAGRHDVRLVNSPENSIAFVYSVCLFVCRETELL